MCLLFPALSPQVHQLSRLSAQLWDAFTDLKVQSGGLRAFTQLKTTSLCVCSSLTIVVVKDRMGQQSTPPKLSGSGPRMPSQPSDTCRGLWMSLWGDRGPGMVMNTQSFISHPWHCSHSDTDTHWDTKPQLPQVADLHTTLGTNATQLYLGLKETPKVPLYTSLCTAARTMDRSRLIMCLKERNNLHYHMLTGPNAFQIKRVIFMVPLSGKSAFIKCFNG